MGILSDMFEFNGFEKNIALSEDNGKSIDYSTLLTEGEKIAGIVSERCLVFILCSNSIGSVMGYVAFLNHRIVPVLLSAQLDSGMFSKLYDIYKPSYIWAPAGWENELEVVYENYGYVLYKTAFDHKALMDDNLALLLTTSGSTGSPKFVRQSYKNIRANADSIIEYLKIDSSERPITTLPMNYTYGLSIINTHLMQGAQILLTEKSLMQKEFWNFFKEAGATSFGGVPYTYEMLKRLHFFRMELPYLRTMTQAGGKLSPELHKEFADYAYENGKSFVVMYGQCEATARMAYLPSEKAVEKKGAMGIAIPGGRFRLIDDNGEEINTAHVAGELVYEGDNVTLGYAECIEDLAKGDERHGVLKTGDVAEFDEDGYFYIVGRKKRFLKIYGNRVNLDEMERLLKERFSIDLACGGMDDKMYIFIASDGPEAEIKQFASIKTGLNQLAFKIVHLESIPRNESGKTVYKELEKYYGIQ